MSYDFQTTPLRVLNRGWNRHGVTPAPFASEKEQEWANAMSRDRVVWIPGRSELPWSKLQWWESEWQARQGIEALCSRPFLDVGLGTGYRDPVLVPTRVLYPYAIQSSESDRIQESARYVAAMVRQAREFYTAAESAGVTDLSRPVLYFYGALGLARAAISAVFGSEHVDESSHGLTTAPGPSAEHVSVSWPTVIQWKAGGEFVSLFRAARWDAEFYLASSAESRFKTFDKSLLPKFHILECIRWIGYDWGLLPRTGFEKPVTHIGSRTDRQRCLLLYRQPSNMFLTRSMPLDASTYEAPLVAVQYMVLYYFSMLARYHGLAWQELLAASTEPEGYVFRVALERVAVDFVAEITHLLPRPDEHVLRKFPWHAERPDLDTYYRQPVEQTGGPQLGWPDMSGMEEWDGP